VIVSASVCNAFRMP